MASSAPVYPGGMIGAGLAVLRLTAAAAVITAARLSEVSDPAQWISAVIAAALALGVWTRRSALLGLLALSILMLATSVTPALLVIAGCLAAVMLTGPGAFALDAHLWGRIHLRTRPPR